jgi:hypothetical protein
MADLRWIASDNWLCVNLYLDFLYHCRLLYFEFLWFFFYLSLSSIQFFTFFKHFKQIFIFIL